MSLSAEDSRVVQQVVEILRNCESLLFITGAGMSADSGIPTYRGIGGLYEVNTTEDGYPIEDILSGHMLSRRPELTWRYLGQIEEAARDATFNRGHEVIAAMESRFSRVWTLTQNVDGFHGLAGSQNVIEIHGNMRQISCTACDYARSANDLVGVDLPPRCPQCSMVLRPDVVLFGEMLPQQAIDDLMEQLETGFDAIFTIGTTSVFPYIAEPVNWARQQGIPTIEINPGDSEVSDMVEIRLKARAAAALDAIWEAMA